MYQDSFVNQVPHPGKLLQEKLVEMEMSIKEFSLRADRTEQLVIDVINGVSPISGDMAVAIEFVTGMDASVLMEWQKQYDEWQARRSHYEKISDRGKEWLKKLPLDEMKANGWVSSTESLSEVLHFFGVASPSAWQNYYFSQKLKVAFRISLEKTVNPYALSAWLRRGEIQAQALYLDNDYSAAKLKETVPSLARLLAFPQDSILDDISSLLAGVGIKMLYTERLSGVPIKGATRWIYGYPCIQLLNSTESYSNFVFTVLHEVGHILLHGKKDIFIEDAGYSTSDPAYSLKEKEADAFAKKWLAIGLKS